MSVQPPRTMSTRNLLIASVLISAIVGSVAGFGTNYLTRSSPAPETKDFYLFARDLSFNTTASGLTSNYAYSSNYIVVNKGDTLIVHFINPTDEHHSFTIGDPYAHNATVQAAPVDSSGDFIAQSTTITIATSQVGTFPFHCVFHSPQMRGSLIVQG